MPPAKTLILFGPGAMSLDEPYFSRILSFIKDDAASQWAVHAIEDIESCWGSLCESMPKLQLTPGASHAQKLAGWLRTGVMTQQSTVANLPNSILGPLVIIAQLVEYLQHVKSSASDSGLGDGQGFQVPSREQTETIGCCLGVFSALVVSSSSSWAQLWHNSAAVLRTVFALGALSDAQDASDAAGPSVSLIAFWRGGQSVSDLKRALDKYPEAYMSVLYDDNRATVTTSTRTASALKTHLQNAGITANETEFHGRFHAGQLYESDLQALVSFCKKHPTFQLPDASCLILPTRVNSENVITGQQHLLEVASRAFLAQQFNWIKAFRSAVSSSLQDRSSRVIEFGPERCVPPTLLRRLNSQVTHFDFEHSISSTRAASSPGRELAPGVAENDIAVIGMSCNVAGAQDLEQYWKILLEGRSQHRELLPNDRFVMESAFRPYQQRDEKKKWYGNFIDDHDTFDYKFFKKSPREVLHMDPQQRLILQAAYQAVVQSGYYHKSKSSPDSRIGCYIGVVANDYENNISHTSPTAFSATGALRSYIAGKVSHYFGWTGPGMTLDTACSASTVAIDLACKAILSGECCAALAGGTNFYSTPMFFQNLAAGSFLSSTGQCKPFDAEADGYCRGEAIGAVFLKKLTDAIADGDQILGVISATAINQNQNTTPIFVPNPASLANVFRTVMSKSGLDVKDISVVEAHGTGTPVGDPAEYDSIRQVFGGSARAGLKSLQVGSVKGLIGHTEGASGVVALIKVLLMMQLGRIPPQASFNSINTAIKALPSDNMDITKAPIPWEHDFKAALINNYGAAGSNASMVIKQAPKLNRLEMETSEVNKNSGIRTSSVSPFKCPFYISGLNDKGIRAYTTRLGQFLKARAISGDVLGIENLAFNVNRQSNWSLGRALIFSSESTDDLDQKLASFETFDAPAPRPVILCFGGQVAKFVGLDRDTFDKATVLRHHLDRCDSVCKSMIGVESIYPGIFQHEPIDDPSVLQPLLFAMQYSCAMSWVDCGVEPAALVGHSFGELTALCVSGVLSLEDALKMVHGRSRIIRDAWGPEKGAMMAVEADLADVENLLAASNARLESEHGSTSGRATIACFNGPRSFTLAGTVAAIDTVQQVISTRDAAATHPVLKQKRLDVTNAFHSTLVEHLKPDLEDLGRKLSFGQPRIPLERATQSREPGPLSAAYVAEHMRQAVYFNHAVQRLAKQYPEAIWLEAGSNSTITTMASRALGLPKKSTFQPVNVTGGGSQALQQLVDATTNLWKAGLRVSFWPHSRAQTYQYAPVLLPPYQFEKHRHWLEFKPPLKQMVNEAVPSDNHKARSIGAEAPPTDLYTFLGYGDDRGENECRFRVNTAVKQYVDLVSGYVLAKTAQSCPAVFGIDLAIQAITSIRPELANNKLHPQIHNIVHQHPILVDPSRTVLISFERLGAADAGNSWSFTFTSSKSEGTAGGETVLHMSGQLYFQPANDARSTLEFSRLERLVTHERCLGALDCSSDDDAEDVVVGRSVYKLYSDVVDYGEKYRGLQKLVGRSSESAGRVVRRRGRSRESWLDSALAEVFTQVAAVWANCMARESRGGAVYVAGGVEQWMKSPDVLREMGEGGFDDDDRDRQEEWHVLAQHKRVGPGDGFITDIFVFGAASGLLEEVILGVRYTLVSIQQLLAMNGGDGSGSLVVPATAAAPGSTPVEKTMDTSRHQVPLLPAGEPPSRVSGRKKNTKAELWVKLLPVLADISGLEPEEVKETDSLADLGIDSLMGMEMAREVETTFSCKLEQSELVSIVDVPGILSFIQSTLGLQDGDDHLSESSHAGTCSENSPPSSNGAMPSTPNSMAEDAHFTGTYDQSDEQTVDLPSSAILEAFGESKARTDYFLKSRGCAGYLDGVSQKQTRLCLALTSKAFKTLGCDLEAAQPGEVLHPVPFVARHERFHEYLYKMLEETRIINVDDDVITRTAIPLPSQSARAILEDLMRHHGDNGASHQLTFNVGSRMADVLSGKADGPQLIFGDVKNRELVASFYGELPFNKLCFEQMADFLTRLATKLKTDSSQNRTTLKILEMGAGTGGTTKVLVPVLARLGMPLEYTFTDLSPSLVAQAKKRFGQYPFMKFAVHDIEKPPSDPQLMGSQHIVIASNAVHATHSLRVSTQNIRRFLRPDGFLMLLEMMGTLHWVDVVWGTLEGWWLFDDGRTHAIVDERRWEKELLGAGYKHVEWTDGELPEVRVQRVLIALAAGAELEDLDRLPAAALTRTKATAGLSAPSGGHDVSDEDEKARKSAADDYTRSTAEGFSIPSYSGPPLDPSDSAATCVLVTGATGSLGSHIVSHLASLPSVDTVYCLNRHAPTARAKKDTTAAGRDPLRRQTQALESKGITLTASSLAKLKAIETDSSRPQLGLDAAQYDQLLAHVTHIVHNAFPVNGLRSLKQNEPQFATMRNLVDLAAAASARRTPSPAHSSGGGGGGGDFRFTFQFVSSLSAVGRYPSAAGAGETRVPEEQFDVDSALPNGYGGAKVVCERVLRCTLGRHPGRFRAMTVRLGQVSGSAGTGYWNHMEVLGFLFKSAQTLRALPDARGVLSWLPLEQASAALGDLLLLPPPRDGEGGGCHPVYHVDNPVPRRWEDVVPVLAAALGVPGRGVVPLGEWLRRVRAYPGEDPWDNPAAKAIEFFEHKFEHMSCGGVTMATDRAREHSPTLRAVQPVSDELVRKYVLAWKASGFLR